MEIVESKVSNENVVIFYQLANIFNLQKFQQQLRSKAHITYHLVANRAKFLDLDYKSVDNILNNSEFGAILEFQLGNAAVEWLQHKSEERGRFANQLTLKISNYIQLGTIKRILDKE